MRFIKLPLILVAVFLLNSRNLYSQNFAADTESLALNNTINLYHQILYPESGLYNGSQYVYSAYYPFVISEGHPFFIKNTFDTGEVFYNDVLYHRVPLLYDIVTEQVLTKDPSNNFIIKLHNENVDWFRVLGHTVIKLTADSARNGLRSGFYEQLYNGKISLYKKNTKVFKPESSSQITVAEQNKYYIKKEDHYYFVRNKKSLLALFSNRKKEVQQFIRKNRLNFRKDADNAFTKSVEFYNKNAN